MRKTPVKKEKINERKREKNQEGGICKKGQLSLTLDTY
jgi:hypothetical protein